MENKDLKWEQELKDSLDKLDGWFPHQTPSVVELERIVRIEQKERKRKLITDLILFWLVGVSAIAIAMVGLKQNPMLFIGAQICAFLGFPFLLFIQFKKRKRVDAI